MNKLLERDLLITKNENMIANVNKINYNIKLN